MVAVLHVDELRGHAQPVAGFSHAPLEDGLNAQLFSDPLNVFDLSLEGEGGSTGDDAHAFAMGQNIDQFIGQAVAEKLVLFVPAVVDKRQHGYRYSCGSFGSEP